MGYYHDMGSWGAPCRRPFPNPDHSRQDDLWHGEDAGRTYDWAPTRLVFRSDPGSLRLRIQTWDDYEGKWAWEGMFDFLTLGVDELRPAWAAIDEQGEWEYSHAYTPVKQRIAGVRRRVFYARTWPVSAEAFTDGIGRAIFEALHPGWMAGI